ncbi:MAG: ABC transporter permease [Planctomycetes bacterium]|nr:ABC transporter permease [Planctomycetota bacterium]
MSNGLRTAVERLGSFGNDGFCYVGGLGYLAWDTVRWSLRALVGRPRISWGALTFQMVRVGIQAIPIIALVHFFIGMILPFEMAPVLRDYGMLNQIATIVVKAIFPQLAPIFSAIVLSGFAGAAIAAELGTMVVSEEILALQTMALNPVRFLVVPRVLACIVMLVCLTIVADLVAWTGGLVVYTFFLDGTVLEYYDRALESLLYRDILSGLVKAVFFAVLVSLISCYEGLRVSGGAQGVGRATTQSVVKSIVAIIACNMILTVFFYYYWPSK